MTPLDPIAARLLGTTLVEASAGTGKTYTITTLFLRLLLERRLAVGEILVVTYTRAATAELRDRIRKRLLEALAVFDMQGSTDDDTLAALHARRAAHGELELDRRSLVAALRDFDEAAISTIHGFCQRSLTEQAFESESPFDLQLVEEQTPIVDQIAHDYWANLAYGAEPELLLALKAGNCEPKNLTRLVGQALRDPNLVVLPEQVETPAIDLGEFEAARAEAAELYRRSRDRLIDALCVPGRLNGNSYKARTIHEKWAPRLDALAEWTPRSAPAWLGRLTPSALRSKLNKGFTYAFDEPFFAAAERLNAACEDFQAALRARVVHARRALFAYAREADARRVRERGEQSFDELLHALDRALRGERGEALAARIRARHKAALIDEFQDTDPVQYGIFRRIFAARDTSLFLIGDPKQAIYGFRGADVFAYIAASQAADARHTLDVNRRSDPRLVTALNTLFQSKRWPFLLPEIGYEPVKPAPDATNRLDATAPALQFLFASRDPRTSDGKVLSSAFVQDQLPERIAHEIAHLLASGETLEGQRIEPRHIAVLCRTNNQARAIQAALGKLRVPSVLDGDSSVFETEMADELARVLWAVARPSDSRRLGAALCSSILGLAPSELQRLRDDEALIEPWLERMSRMNQLWHERGFVQMLHQLLDETSARSKLLARFDGERRLTDLLHLSELLHRTASSEHLGPLALLQWFARMRSSPKPLGDMASESTQLRLEHDEQATKLTTVHRSKGLEYPIVFCPFVSTAPYADPDPRFHDRRDGDRIKLDLGSPQLADHKRLAANESLAENLRLFYVALTRAKHRCYLVWGRFHESGLSPLAYLLYGGPLANDAVGAAVESLLKDKNDASLRAVLAPLCEASGNTVGLRDLRFDDALPYPGGERAQGELGARQASRSLRPMSRSASFSSLTAARGERAAAAEQDSADRDEARVAGPSDETPQPPPHAALPLNDFPAGSRPGTMIHAVFEHVDFTRGDEAELPAEVARLLDAFGLDRVRHAETLTRAIDETLRTPLDASEPPLTLSRIERSARVDELEFLLSARDAPNQLSAGRLAAAFERHGAPTAAPDYPRRLRELPMLPPSGFFNGFIDLVFRHEGRYYIVDYKSNHLGPRASDYEAARLVAPMREHHYFLQYHLYTLALHRHLGLRLAGYDYERDFGGVFYLFVRGMSPSHTRGTGVFFDRPRLALIEELARTLGASEVAA